MKIGVSSYSFSQAVSAGRMSTYDIVDAAARIGFEALDFAVLLGDDPIPELCARLGRQATDAGLPVKNYAVSADFLANDVDAEVEKTCREVDNAVLLGAQTFRHDVTWTQPRQGAAFTFESVLPRLAEGCRRVTEYAAQRGIRLLCQCCGKIPCHHHINIILLRLNTCCHSKIPLIKMFIEKQSHKYPYSIPYSVSPV